MRPPRALMVVSACALAVLTACGSSENRSTPGGPTPGGSTTAGTTATATGAATGTATGAPGGSDRTPGSATPTAAAVGPVWPIEPRSIAPVTGSALPVLKAIRTGRHGTYERLVLEFTAAYGSADVGYVPVVRADPSDTVVPLAGASYLQIVVHGAVARYAATPITPYAGPSTVTPGYPTLKQVAISGDFESVLSFGVGLGRTAGFQVTRLRSPDRLVVDVAEPPAWRMWPDTGLASARAAQTAFDQGHQSWRGSADAVAQAYARAVYGWATPVVTRVGSDRYRLAQLGSSDSVVVRTTQPFRSTSAHGIVEIAETR